MVLCGIGGRTIEEAQQRLSNRELKTWARFRKMRGSLFIGNRLEEGFATLIATMINLKGGSAAPVDFAPHSDEHLRTAADLSEVMGILSGKRK